MIKIIMHGCNGKMGQAISEIVKNDEEATIVAGIDPYTMRENEYPVFDDITKCDIIADVIIDFATSTAIDKLLSFAKERKIPVVLCTTGLTEEQLEAVEEASKEVAILKSANMSVGVNLLFKLVQEATKMLAKDYDIEIVERHHNQKIDAPSGTALAFGDKINEVLDNEYEYVYDRSTERKKRTKKEIGFSAVRGGSIVGDHDIIFAGLDEVIEFHHSAYSKAVFAKGAVTAAKFLAGKHAGRYDMSDVIKL
ncbi:4-hydroxy-tetrahydrodipicolinate reductase [Anaerosporobacter sp.]|uniref:4-hydroxy-tetrahydrodipicolinate reductase n=1 Tax=Anaerosporobacter sp. TaxID=1872529 RepID=UPI00286ED1A9|nr:4-hydroxy-tetrahydrodipicolinate reductase [Anaerosporobacter sp.]